MHCLVAQAVKVLNMIKVFGKPIRVNKASQDKRQQDVGANLFIGNLDQDVDEKVSTLVEETPVAFRSCAYYTTGSRVANLATLHLFLLLLT